MINNRLQEWGTDQMRAAAAQGWLLSEVDYNTVNWLEIQRVDDAVSVGELWDVIVPQLEDDQQAVAALYTAWQQNQPHAVLAVDLIRDLAPSEYQHWFMNTWARTTG